MFKKRDGFLKISEDKKRLVSNFFSLSALQGINLVLPLITLQYLVRVLGVENYGLINFVVSIIMYFNILISFGFELSATREISIHREDNKKISEIFSAVMIIKTIMLLFSLVTLSMLVLFIDSFKAHALLYYATFGIVIGDSIFPSWFFQGMERMKYITYINVFSKSLFAVLIFVFIKEKTDYIYVPLLNSAGSIIGGVYALWLVFKLFPIQFVIPSKEIIYTQLKDSFRFFLSRIANNGSRYFATTIIGLYFGNLLVGYYSMVEKLFYAFMSIGSIISQTIYPYMSRTRNIQFFKKIFIFIVGLSILLLLPIICFNEEILFLVFGVRDAILSKIFIIVFSAAIFSIASALLGYPLLAALGHIKYANNSLIYASFIYVGYTSLVVIFTQNIYLVSSAISIYMALGFLFRVYYVRKTKILF